MYICPCIVNFWSLNRHNSLFVGNGTFCWHTCRDVVPVPRACEMIRGVGMTCGECVQACELFL